MFYLKGNVIDVIEKPAEPARDGKKERPAQAVVQVVGYVKDFGGAMKKKIWDVAFADIAAAKKLNGTNVELPVDLYPASKGTMYVSHLPNPVKG